MKGPAASHPAPAAAPLPGTPPTAAIPTAAPHAFPRPRGGTLRSALQSAACAALFVTGLDLWLSGQQQLVLWLHLLAGLGLLVWLAPWLIRHIPKGLDHSRRRLFTNLSWALLACWLALFATGLVMALPAALWLAGLVWFPERPVTEALSLVHFWASWLAMGGLVLHLAMRHWQRGRA